MGERARVSQESCASTTDVRHSSSLFHYIFGSIFTFTGQTRKFVYCLCDSVKCITCKCFMLFKSRAELMLTTHVSQRFTECSLTYARWLLKRQGLFVDTIALFYFKIIKSITLSLNLTLELTCWLYKSWSKTWFMSRSYSGIPTSKSLTFVIIGYFQIFDPHKSSQTCTHTCILEIGAFLYLLGYLQ